MGEGGLWRALGRCFVSPAVQGPGSSGRGARKPNKDRRALQRALVGRARIMLERLGLRGLVSALESFGLQRATPRTVARERLSIILAHQRLSDVNIEALQRDVLECVQKYIPVTPERAVSVKVKQDGEVDVFQMEIALSTPARSR